ncbi:MAG: aldehyde dehydrogenase family protein [Pyrinomonadaceae bacterium]
MARNANELISTNPATGVEVGRVQISSTDDVAAAVLRSRKAFGIWRKTPFAERKRIVMRAREVILAETDEIARLISDEMGKPVAEAISNEIVPVLDLMQFFAKNSERLLRTETRKIGLLSLMGRYSRIAYKPLGVIGIISPWNFPLSIPLGEVVMALMAGNSVILKPSELTPLVGEKIAQIFGVARIPKDVLQVVNGNGGTGAALVKANVDKIMFTGSVETGKRIAAEAANTLTPVVLELGGKDPMIVCKDANLEKASSAAVWGAFTNAGQACASIERLYVDETIAEKFTALVVEKTKNLKIGYGSDPETDVSTLSSVEQLNTVEQHISEFKKEGAKILTGGTRSDLGEAFYEPTVIAKVKNSMKPMQRETFGPTLPIVEFKTVDDAISLANDSEFGLTASIWTANTTRGKEFAEKLEFGTVMVNEVVYTHGVAQTPWGGVKNSGYGRTHGVEGLHELVSVRHIHVNRFTFLPDVWWFGYSQNAIDAFKTMSKTFASGSLIRTFGFLPKLFDRLKELNK